MSPGETSKMLIGCSASVSLTPLVLSRASMKSNVAENPLDYVIVCIYVAENIKRSMNE